MSARQQAHEWLGGRWMFEHGFIEVHNANQNNLQHVNIKVPKYAISVFVGRSGSGKSSLVFDTIAAESRRELNETFPSFTQQYLPKYGQPDVGSIDHLPVAIVVEQKRIGKNARSTLATYTGIYSLLRLLFFPNRQTFYRLFGYLFIQPAAGNVPNMSGTRLCR